MRSLIFLIHFLPLVAPAAINVYTKGPQNESSALELRATADPHDFSWVRSWAAIGDSFTAGIGSGNVYSRQKEDKACSRYDYAYPAILNRHFGPSVSSFQYPACSGARSTGIADQIAALKGGLDLVMMTAGGNDLCLSSIIKTCIFLPFQSESNCDTIINLAQSNIDNILKPNIRELLVDLNSKVNKGGIVVLNLYAKYFNTETDDCEKSQDWTFPSIIFSGLPLTIDRRTRFNTLVDNTNAALQSVVDDISNDPSINYKVTTSDWDPWPIDSGGQFCQPGASGDVNDPANADIQFFKRTTQVISQHMELKRDVDGLTIDEKLALMESASNPYYSGLFISSTPAFDALRQLDKRTPAPPNCPGDGGFDWTFGWGLPDRWGKYFHPTKSGHETISAFALEAVAAVRAQELGVVDSFCTNADEFTCWQKTGSHAYASADRLNANYPDFCDRVGNQVPANTVGWKFSYTYHAGTPDEHSFTIQLSNQVSSFVKDACNKAFDMITNACDGNDPNNPMNFKFGGQRVEGEYTYTIDIKRTNRPWPVPLKPSGKCWGWWHVGWSSYEIYGQGWSDWDYGQQTLNPNAKGCFGLGLTMWKFEYFDQPNSDGMEWKANFNTPVFVRARCFSNNKVAIASGGFTDGCAGNDA